MMHVSPPWPNAAGIQRLKKNLKAGSLRVKNPSFKIVVATIELKNQGRVSETMAKWHNQMQTFLINEIQMQVKILPYDQNRFQHIQLPYLMQRDGIHPVRSKGRCLMKKILEEKLIDVLKPVNNPF